MNNIEIYAWSWCPYCIAAKKLLSKKKLDYTEYDATNATVASRMQQRSGRSSVPQIFLNGMHLGGYDDLKALDQTGELDQLLNATMAMAQ